MRSLEHRERGKQEHETPSYFYGSGHAAGDLCFTIGGVIVEEGGAKWRYLDHNGRASNAKNSQLAAARRVALKWVGCFAARQSRIDLDLLLERQSGSDRLADDPF